MANPTLNASRMASTVFERYERCERWEIEHAKVNLCWRMEDGLKESDSIFKEYADVLREYIEDTRWEPDWGPDEEKEFHVALGSILRSCTSIDNSISRVEQRTGYHIEGSQAFRENHELIKSLSKEIDRISSAEGRMGYGDIKIDAEGAIKLKEMLDLKA